MLSYYQLKNDITAMLKRADLPADKFTIFPGPINNEGLFYETYEKRYIIGYFERGVNTVLLETTDLDEFYYNILKDIISNYAIDYEIAHRISYQSTNKIYFAKALEWMKMIDENYYKKLKNYFDEALKDSPFNDNIAIQMDSVNANYLN